MNRHHAISWFLGLSFAPDKGSSIQLMVSVSSDLTCPLVTSDSWRTTAGLCLLFDLGCEKKHGRMQRFEGKMGSDNSAVNDETKKSSKIMILEPKPNMLNKEIILLSSSDDEDHDNSNCKDFFTTKQDAKTFQNNNLDLVVAVSAHKKELKDDSDRETVIERISKMTRKQIVDFEIDNSEIVDIMGYLGRSVPIISFCTKCSSGEKIRRCLNMTEAGPYFDSDSQAVLDICPHTEIIVCGRMSYLHLYSVEEAEGVESPVSRAEQQQVGTVERDQSHKRILLLPKQLDEDSKKIFRRIFTRSFLPITKKEANQLLLLSSPKEVLPVSKADKPQEQPKLIISNVLQPVVRVPMPVCRNFLLVRNTFNQNHVASTRFGLYIVAGLTGCCTRQRVYCLLASPTTEKLFVRSRRDSSLRPHLLNAGGIVSGELKPASYFILILNFNLFLREGEFRGKRVQKKGGEQRPRWEKGVTP
uniref:Uncharacterized protein n=1 Tax=Timema genevievae TaxID=629358 RepID=A0A7R9PIW4_TIMGE|nr:unnamed protein product [Timema genevievae]